METMQRYYRIERSSEPSIIGIHDAGAQIEVLNKKSKHSFANETEWHYFNDFIHNNKKDTNRVSLHTFVPFDTSKISMLNGIKTKQKIKEVDILYYTPRFIGFDIIISKKFLNIIEKHNLFSLNKIPMNIDGFNTEYYLIGFPLIDISEIDFRKSTFCSSFSDEKYVFNTFEEYKNHYGLKENVHIVLRKKLEYDILKINFGIYFSEKLIDSIKKENLKALEISKDNTLEC
jgi:hypothetical protein